MRRLDRRRAIAFVDVSDAATACPIDRETLLARFHADENGRLLSGAAAFAAMWRAIPLLKPLGYLADIPAIRPLFEATYRRFLKVRPHLQRFFA